MQAAASQYSDTEMAVAVSCGAREVTRDFLGRREHQFSHPMLGLSFSYGSTWICGSCVAEGGCGSCSICCCP